ncbi:MAG: aspartate kinase [Eubacteriales bacterium]|nr:aspartate kinase [Eubacteriales bacterium]
MIVAKFGGSSLSDAKQFQNVRRILEAEPARQYIVVSAPGKRDDADQKVTDLLIACHQLAHKGEAIYPVYSVVEQRFAQIADALGLENYLNTELLDIGHAIQGGASHAFTASRGEYLSALLMAKWLDRPFVDAAALLRFAAGKLDEEATSQAVRRTLSSQEGAVIPGFYGSDGQGGIHVLSRGGSDTSAACIAAALDAELLEIWTDVTGFRAADPRIVPDAQYIASLTYRELRELSYMGASVLHEDAVFPVRTAGIPTSIRNTGNPLHPGTTITYHSQTRVPVVTGIAGKKGFSIIVLEKNRMNDEVGFARKVLAVFERHGISFEHLPTGIDALCVMVMTSAFAPKREAVLQEIHEAVSPDSVHTEDRIALVACVGVGMFRQYGTAARLITAVSEQGIGIRTMLQAPSELSIILGVDEENLDKTVNAIYDAFIRT